MTGIFINYRRDDAPGVAGRLYDHLAKSFSRRDLFIDVDAIKPGLDFVKQLDTQVSQCDVLLALIGPHWLKAEDEQGGQRLQGDRDYVRIEIAAALKRDIPVIPVLINGADMPVEAQLPEDLKSLSRRHALELRHTRFAADADAIAAALKDALPKRKSRWPYMAAAACLAAAVGLGTAFYVWRGLTPSRSTAMTPPAAAPTREPAPGTPTAPSPSPVSPQSASGEQASPSTGQPLTVAEAERRVAEAKRKIAAIKGEAPPSPAEAPSPDAKPMPGIEGITVALGDPRDGVRQAYPQAADSGSGNLAMPFDGIRFFFTKDGKTLNEIMVEAPFAGSVDGIKIGDTADDIVTQRGQPYAIADVYGGSGYLYHAGGNILRYDIDEKSKKVTDIVQILDR